jgi:CBS domain-containing protein
VALGSKKLEGWVVSSGRRSAALRALASEDVLTAAQISRMTGRTVQNISNALRELSARGLAEVVGESRRSWRHYRLTHAGSAVARRLGPPADELRSDLRAGMAREVELKTVRDAYQLLIARPVIAHPEERLGDALRRLLEEPRTRTLYVVDDDGRLLGSLPLVRILEILDVRLEERDGHAVDVEEYAEELRDQVGEHLRKGTTVGLGDTLKSALRKMVHAGLEDVAVVSEDGALLGELNGYEVLTLALAASKQMKE